MAEKMKKRLIFIAMVFTTSYSGGAMAIEEPKFSVDAKMEHYQIDRRISLRILFPFSKKTA
jgi:hypothetical protein